MLLIGDVIAIGLARLVAMWLAAETVNGAIAYADTPLLEGGARFFCHGSQTRGLKVGATVAIEAIDDVYYFSHLGALDRARLFWRRAGRAGDRVNAMTRSVVKRMWKGTSSG